MKEKQLTIYIGGDLKPYQDKELTKPLAQVSDNTYVGENNATEVLFDLTELSNFGSAIANIKKPDGSIYYKILEKNDLLYKLDLDDFYTNQKGALIISISLYEAGVAEVEEVNGEYHIELNGDEKLITTAPIKLYINYTPYILPSGKTLEINDLQKILYALSYKIDKDARINGKEITPNTELFATDILVERSGVFEQHTIQEFLYQLLGEKVEKTTKVNGKALESDIELFANDIFINTLGHQFNGVAVGNAIETLFNEKSSKTELALAKSNLESLISDLENATESDISNLESQVETKLATKQDKKPNAVDNLLNENHKINAVYIPESILGQLEYMGTFSGSILPIATQKGQYWVYNGSGATIGGVDYMTGDWAVFNGVSFDKVDNTDAVQSVNGRTGNVLTTAEDVIGLDDKIATATIDLVPITYSALKTLRDTNKLVVGRKYRITDYETTTSQIDTMSAGNPFDIIVSALTTNKLDEKASAIQRVGDTYFSGQKLESWQVWYSLDNDTSLFAWADNVNGKGVIYRLIDERFNDLRYDFKNIKFKRCKITAMSGVSEELETLLVGKYYGIKKSDSVIPSMATIDESDFIYAFTFQSESVTDRSLATVCYNNSFGLGVDNITLGNNVFFGNVISGSDIKDRFYDNTFGLGQHYALSFGYHIYNNVFVGEAYRLTIGNNFNTNTIGNGFNTNSVGNYFNTNTIGNNFNNNSVGNYFYNNTIGNNNRALTIGNYVFGITTGTYFSRSRISDYCSYLDLTTENLYGVEILSNTRGPSEENKLVCNVVGTALTTSASKTISLSTGTKQFVLNGFVEGQRKIYTKTLGTENAWTIVEEELDGGTF